MIIRRNLHGDWIEFGEGPRGIEMPFQSSIPQEALLEDFAASVRTRRAPVAFAQSAVLPLQIMEAAYASRQRMAQP